MAVSSTLGTLICATVSSSSSTDNASDKICRNCVYRSSNDYLQYLVRAHLFIVKILLYLLLPEQNILVTFLHNPVFLHCRLLEQLLLGAPKNEPSTSCFQTISTRNEKMMQNSPKFFIFSGKYYKIDVPQFILKEMHTIISLFLRN